MPPFSPPSRAASLREKQPHVANSLEAILYSSRLPNALLFTGNPNTGKKEAAHLFAMSLNCTSTGRQLHLETHKGALEPCMVCSSCKKTIADMHPDILVITPEKDKIKIAGIRDLYHTLASPPHEGSHRMVLVTEAHKMNQEAANALLKILEEPPSGTFFILTAQDLSGLLPTIISRCRHLRFTPTPLTVLNRQIQESTGADPMQTAIAVATADGTLDMAHQLLNQDKNATTDWKYRRKWLISALFHLVEKQNCTDASPALFLAERLTRNTDELKIILTLINTWLRDLMVVSHDPRQVINKDVLADLQALSTMLTGKKAVAWIKALHTAEKRILANATPRLALECFFLTLATDSVAP
ncbi:DNA polymerase III subunit delta' [Desulfocicer niacini]